MNLLTKSLLEDLLDTKKTVAIYGGGFKPPTKGHFTVAELALKELPDIDELKIFVGGGVRDGITQNESIQVWDIYKKYLSPKVSVEPSVAPVKSVLGYAKENPDTKVYWVLGARDGEESDLEDIKNRTKSLDKYPNLEVKVITSKGGISGTKTRAAIKANNKEQFFSMIPDIDPREQDQIWNIVSPVIKEGLVSDLKSKFKDFISAVKQENQETKEIIGLLVHAAQGKIELSDKDKEYIGNQLKDVLKLVGLVGIAALPGGFIAGALIKLFKAESLVTPSAFVNEVGEANLKPYKWKEVDAEGYYVYTRFVTDSETQYDVDIKSTMYFPPGQMESRPALEIEFTAKPKGAEGSSAKIVVNKGEMYRVMATIVDIIKKYLKKSKAQAIIYSPSKKSSEENFGAQRDNLYRAFISKAIPGVTFKQSGDFITAILPPVKEASDPEAGTALPYGSGFAPVKELVTDTEVICDNCGWEWKIEDGGKDLYICHKCGHDNNPALNEGKQVGPLYHYTSTDALKSILQSNKIKGSFMYEINKKELYGVSTTRNKNFQYDPQRTNVRITLDGDKLSNNYKITPRDYWERQYNIPDNPQTVDEDEEVILTPKGYIDNIKNYILAVDKLKDLQEALNDPFGLNELARQFLKEALIETWNPEESFVSLSRYMIDNGMNIQPLPKIKVIKDDKQNASNLLGKTAYYNPVEKSITLYTMDRHPKDILRSFAHEMIHHEQNLDGRLGNINTTNTNEDGDLPEIEREAYEKGNMMLRNWEDKIKNPSKEYFLDIPKFNKPLTLTENLWKTLNEISLNPNNAAEIEGDLYRGMFKAGNKVYTYDIYRIENPYKDGKEFYNVEFHPKNNSISTPTGDTTKEDYIKILNTMYKIILDFAEDDEPDYIGIASMDSSSNKNYHKIYNNLTDNKFNNIPGYFRKDVNLEFNTPQGKGRFVVLKRKDV